MAIPEKLSSLIQDIDKSFWNGDANLTLQFADFVQKLTEDPDMTLAQLGQAFSDSDTPGLVVSGISFTVDAGDALSFGESEGGFAVSIGLDAAAGAWLHLISVDGGIEHISDDVPGLKEILDSHTGIGDGESLVVLSFNGSIGVNVAGSGNFGSPITVGLEFGAGAGYQWFHCQPAVDTTKVLTAVGDAFGDTRLPQTSLPDVAERDKSITLRENEVISSRYLGFVNIGVTATWGWEFTGTKSYGVGALDLTTKLQVEAAARLSLSYALAGAFRVTVVPGREADWIRVMLDKDRQSSFEFGAGITVDAKLETEGLPSKDDSGLALIESVIGTSTPKILRDALRIAKLDPDALHDEIDGFLKELIGTWAGKGFDVLKEEFGEELEAILSKIRRIEDEIGQIDDRAISLYEKFLDKINFDDFVERVDAVLDAAADVGPDTLLDQINDPRMKQLLEMLTDELFGDLFVGLDRDRDNFIAKIREPFNKFKKLVTSDAKDAIREFIEAKLEALHITAIMEQVARFDTLEELEEEATDAIKELVGRLFDSTWEKLMADGRLGEVLAEIKQVADTFSDTLNKVHDYVEKALNYSGKLDISYAYQRVREQQQLIDIEIKVVSDGAPNDAGMALYAAAVDGDWQKVLRDENLDIVRVNSAAFSDVLMKKKTLKAHIFGWDYKSVSKLLTQLDTGIEIGPAGLMTVYTLKVVGETDVETGKRTTQMRYMLEVAGSLKGAFGPDAIRAEEIDANAALSSLQNNFQYNIEDELTSTDELADYFGIGVNLGMIDEGQLERLTDSINELRDEAGLDANDYGKVEVKYTVVFSGQALADALVHDFSGWVPCWDADRTAEVKRVDSNREALEALYVDRLIASDHFNRNSPSSYSVTILYRLGIFHSFPNVRENDWVGTRRLTIRSGGTQEEIAVDIPRVRVEWAEHHYFMNVWLAKELDEFRVSVSDGSIRAEDLERFMQEFIGRLQSIGRGGSAAQQALPFMLLDEMVKRANPGIEGARTALLDVTLYGTDGEPMHSILVHG